MHWPVPRSLRSAHLRRSAGSRRSVVSFAIALAAGRHGARSLRTSRAPVPPHNAAAQGSEVSRGHVLKNLLLQRQLRHYTLQLRVLSLQLLQPFRLIQLQAAELFPPAVVRLNGDLCFLAGLGGVLPVCDFYFNLPQQRHNLLRLVFLHRHVQLSFRVIFSHSCWTNSSRSRQFPEATSFRICFSKDSSATKRFSFAFSRSSSFIRFA